MEEAVFETQGGISDWPEEKASRMQINSFRRLLLMIWVIWSSRNDWVHNDVEWSMDRIVCKVETMYLQGEKWGHSKVDLRLSWDGAGLGTKMVDGWVILCDGSWSNKDDRAGWGVVAKKDSIVWTVEAGWTLNMSSSFEAESLALLKGLRMVERLQLNRATVLSDSAAVVWAVSAGGSGRGMEANSKIYECVKLLASFKDWRVEHVCREENVMADSLSKKARHMSWS